MLQDVQDTCIAMIRLLTVGIKKSIALVLQTRPFVSIRSRARFMRLVDTLIAPQPSAFRRIRPRPLRNWRHCRIRQVSIVAVLQPLYLVVIRAITSAE
jgi:hypothetical protein